MITEEVKMEKEYRGPIEGEVKVGDIIKGRKYRDDDSGKLEEFHFKINAIDEDTIYYQLMNVEGDPAWDFPKDELFEWFRKCEWEVEDGEEQRDSCK